MRLVVASGAVLIVVAGCSSTPVRPPLEPAARPPGTYSTTPPPTPPTTPKKSGGSYYLDDGPGDNPPPNLEFLPDAVPRVEKYASGANRPYNVFGVDYVPDLSGNGYKQRGVGSWYGRKFHGQRTSSGEIYDMYAMTAAHPTLPIPCYALVTNLQNGKSVIVRVNDRGPFLHNRVMDLSYAAAYKLGYMSSGSGMIEVEMLMPVDIAAGRVPTTTTGLLLASGAQPTTPPSVATVPTKPAMTIEDLIASRTDAGSSRPTAIATNGTSTPATPGPSLPPAPVVVADAVGRSLPLPLSSSSSSPKASSEPAPDLIALPDRQPAATLPEIATGSGFYLQLGAFRVRAGADSFAAHVGRELDPMIASRIHVSDANGLFRVRVGPYPRRAEADDAAANLRAAIAMPVLVMPESSSR